MAKSPEQLLETETIILWSEAENVAVLDTASPAVRKTWESFGFPVKAVVNAKGKVTGWTARVPVDRISYKPMKGAK
jgi:hypothetical protein